MNKLECGHEQMLSEHRQRLAASGYEQKPMWCITCGDWTRVIPDEPNDIVDTSDNDVLQ